MKHILIRLASNTDSDIVDRFHGLLFSDDMTTTKDDIHVFVSRAIQDHLVWIAEVDGKPVGHVMCEFFDESHKNFPNSIFLSGLYVLEDYRKQGIGRALVEHVLQQKYPRKYTCFSLTHDPDESWLTSYYKTFGFIACGFTNAGNVKMTRPLNIA
jgi:predicted N-acetyltransferase YhbS